jgi:hypothetical protein
MRFSLFGNILEGKRLNQMILIFISSFIIMNLIVNYAFTISGYPVSFMESQLSFSGELIKSHFSIMTDNQIELYFYAQIVDYVFIFVYSCLIFVIGIYLARSFQKNSLLQKSGYVVALSGIVAGICDASENVFIILMINNHTSFPNIYAIIHSCFALLKFILLGCIILWIILLFAIIIIRKFKLISNNSKK